MLLLVIVGLMGGWSLFHPQRWHVELDYETGKPVVVRERWWGMDTLRLPARFVRGQDGYHGSWQMGSGNTWMPVPLSSELISNYDAGLDLDPEAR